MRLVPRPGGERNHFLPTKVQRPIDAQHARNIQRLISADAKHIGSNVAFCSRACKAVMKGFNVLTQPCQKSHGGLQGGAWPLFKLR